jgi:hypothetical protein
MQKRSRIDRSATISTTLTVGAVTEGKDTEGGNVNDHDGDHYYGKNPAAVALGRLGGKKGGKARAARMTAEARSEAARRAAIARWSSRGDK